MKNNLDNKTKSLKEIVDIITKDNITEQDLNSFGKKEYVKLYSQLISFMKAMEQDGDAECNVFRKAGFEKRYYQGSQSSYYINVKLSNPTGLSDISIEDPEIKQLLGDDFLKKAQFVWNKKSLKTLDDFDCIDTDEVNNNIEFEINDYANHFFSENEKYQEILDKNRDFLYKKEDESFNGRSGGWFNTGIGLKGLYDETYDTFGSINVEDLEGEFESLKKSKNLSDFEDLERVKQDIISGSHNSYLGRVLNYLSTNKDIQKCLLKGENGYEELLDLFASKLNIIQEEVLNEKKYVEKELPKEVIINYIRENVEQFKKDVNKQYDEKIKTFEGFSEKETQVILDLKDVISSSNHVSYRYSSRTKIPSYPYFGTGHKELLDYLIQNEKSINISTLNYHEKILYLIGHGNRTLGENRMVEFYNNKIEEFKKGNASDERIKNLVEKSLFNYNIESFESYSQLHNEGLFVSIRIKDEYNDFLEVLNSTNDEKDVIENKEKILKFFNKFYNTNYTSFEDFTDENILDYQRFISKLSLDTNLAGHIGDYIGYQGMDKGNYLADMLVKYGYLTKDNISKIHKKLEEKYTIINQFGPYLKATKIYE